MSVVGDLLTLLAWRREDSDKLDSLLAGQKDLMNDFDDLAGKVAGLDTKVDGLTAAAVSAGGSLTNIRGDIAKLQEIIAGAGSGGLPPAQVAQLGALIDAVDAKAADAVTSLSAVADEAASVAAIVPEDAPTGDPT